MQTDFFFLEDPNEEETQLHIHTEFLSKLSEYASSGNFMELCLLGEVIAPDWGYPSNIFPGYNYRTELLDHDQRVKIKGILAPLTLAFGNKPCLTIS